MASRPDFTENADHPLGSDELAADLAASPRGDDNLDTPDGLSDGSEADDDGDTEIAGDSVEDLDEGEQDAVETALTRLPPG